MIILTSEKLDVLAFEILKAKHNLQELSVKEIFSAYLNIRTELDKVNIELDTKKVKTPKLF